MMAQNVAFSNLLHRAFLQRIAKSLAEEYEKIVSEVVKGGSK